MYTFHRKHSFILVIATVFFIFGLTQVAFAQTCPTGDGSEPFTTGPVNPNNGFATFVEDSGSVLGAPIALEICLDGDGVTGPCIFDAVDPANPYSVQVGFGAEAFWYLATTGIDNQANNFSAEITIAVEAAWVAEVPIEGENFPFTRLRIRLDVPATGSYIVTHPYGQITYEVAALLAGRDVNDPIDIPFAPNATNQNGRILPYLIWDPAVAPAAPAGYIGDPQALHTVIGSPCGTNEFTVTPPAGVDIGGGPGMAVTETLFTVQGKISTLFGVSVNQATYTRFAGGGGKVDVWASSQTGQTIEITGVANRSFTMVEDPGTGNYFGRSGFGPAAGAPTTITATNLDDGLAVDSVVDDVVVITRAKYFTNTGDLEIIAKSNDRFVTQTLQAFDENDQPIGLPFASGTTLTVNLAIPPSTVTVRSTGQGEATRLVEVGGPNVVSPIP